MKRLIMFLLNMVIFLTSMYSFAYASVGMEPFQTKVQVERGRAFRILFIVLLIFGRLIVAAKREQRRETYELQEQVQPQGTTVLSPLPVAQIKVDRDSVCMGDDATAPNIVLVDLLETDKLSDIVLKVVHHLPLMSNSVWAVDSGKEVIAYIITDDRKGFFSYELCVRNGNALVAGIEELHCSYFSSYGENVPPIVTAKRSMRRCFMEKLKMKDGVLSIWGEPVGKLHVVEIVEWNRQELRIRFAEGYLHIYEPTGIINENKQLIIENAVRILWIWYEPGKAHTSENMYQRQYTKTEEGAILRAEGKQNAVSDDDGAVIHPQKEQAVLLEDQFSSVSHIPKIND